MICCFSTLDEMMENLTTCLYRVKGVSPAPKSSRPRFAHYRFRRSAVPEFLPEECRYYFTQLIYKGLFNSADNYRISLFISVGSFFLLEPLQ